jgi:hypothetical protein
MRRSDPDPCTGTVMEVFKLTYGTDLAHVKLTLYMGNKLRTKLNSVQHLER